MSAGRDHGYHLAQLNVALMRAPFDTPLMAGFASQLEHINAIADRAEGFVWRPQSDEGDATAIRASHDPLLLVNMSVWESREALRAYVYRSAHVGPLRNRTSWFQPPKSPHLVLWWIPRDTIPRVEQGMARLKYLARHGATRWAFTFHRSFPPPGHREQEP